MLDNSKLKANINQQMLEWCNRIRVRAAEAIFKQVRN